MGSTGVGSSVGAGSGSGFSISQEAKSRN